MQSDILMRRFLSVIRNVTNTGLVENVRNTEYSHVRATFIQNMQHNQQ